MRLTLASTLILALGIAVPCVAQDWVEFVDRAERFGINLPGQPTIRETTYIGDNAEKLPARLYTAEEGPNRYAVTVVNYGSVENVTTVRGAISWAAWNFRKRPAQVTYDAYAQVDRIEGHQLQLANADRSRTYVGIYLHARRLYILEATVPPGVPPPLDFQQTLVIFDADGRQIRYELDADGNRTRVR